MMPIKPTATIDTPNPIIHKPNQTSLAIKDFADGLKQWRIWIMLAYHDIKLRYRRSVLGPLWITLSMAITVYSMGYLYGHLFRSDMLTYFPFVAAGMLAWSLLSTLIIDAIEIFNLLERTIKQIKMPYTLYIHRVVTRNYIIFFHNILIMIPIYIVFHNAAKINFNSFLLIPNLLLIYLNAITYGLIFAMLGARYRDIPQMVKSLIQVAFFLTPVMWNPNLLPPDKMFLIYLNPFYSMVELIRAPMIGTLPNVMNYSVVGIITAIGLLISFKMFTRYRSRIVYWL